MQLCNLYSNLDICIETIHNEEVFIVEVDRGEKQNTSEPHWLPEEQRLRTPFNTYLQDCLLYAVPH